MEITQGAVVSLSYTLRGDDGELLDDADQSIEYLHGYDNIIPGLERVLEGAEPGQQRSVVVKAVDAYGEHDPAAVISVPSDAVEEDAELTPGMIVVGDTPSGPVQLTVVEVNTDNIVVDGNHPLAGKRLHFEIYVVGVRLATDEELAEGCPQ